MKTYSMMDLREKAIATGLWRVKIGDNLFRDNQPGDPLPEPGATYGLPDTLILELTMSEAEDLLDAVRTWVSEYTGAAPESDVACMEALIVKLINATGETGEEQ